MDKHQNWQKPPIVSSNVEKLFGSCLEGVWKVFGRCLEDVWKVFGRCLEGVWEVFGRCLAWPLRIQIFWILKENQIHFRDSLENLNTHSGLFDCY